MGRATSSGNNELLGMNKGSWSAEEDKLLVEYIKEHGEGKWGRIAKLAGIRRCGKSCRLRWLNYLRPGIKRGNISLDEEDLIIRLHRLLGNRWSLIAGRLPGRTDNEIKNYWNSTLAKRVQPRHQPNISPCQSKKTTESTEPKRSGNKLPEKSMVINAPAPPKPKLLPVIRTNATNAQVKEKGDYYVDGRARTPFNSLNEDPSARKWTVSSDADSFSSGDSFEKDCLRKWKVGDHMLPDSEFWDMLGDWMTDDGYASELA